MPTAPKAPTFDAPTVTTATSGTGGSVVAAIGEPVTVRVHLHAGDGGALTDYTMVWSHAGTRTSDGAGDEALTVVPNVGGNLLIEATASVCNGTRWVPRLSCASVTVGPIRVHVWGAPTESLTFRGDAATMVVGEVRVLQAFAVGTALAGLDGATPIYVPAADRPTYASDDATVAQIDGDGVVTALRAGSVVLRARAGAVEATLLLTVGDGALGPPAAEPYRLARADQGTNLLVRDFRTGYREGALALDQNDWPTVTLTSSLRVPVAEVDVWSGSGFGHESASAVWDVATHPQVVRGHDGRLWVAYYSVTADAWTIAERLAPGKWQQTPLPARIDPNVTVPWVASDVVDQAGPNHVVFGLVPAEADDPEGGVWAAYELVAPRGVVAATARVERRIRLAHVVSGQVTVSDISIACDGSEGCSDAQVRKPLGNLTLARSTDRWPRVIALETDARLMVYERGSDGAWSGHAILPRPGANPHDDLPNDFALVSSADGTSNTWVWMSFDHRSLSWQTLPARDADPELPLPGDHRVAVSRLLTASPDSVRPFGVMASDGSLWLGARGLAAMTMMRPDGFVTTDELASPLTGEDAAISDWSVYDAFRAGGMVARGPSMHVVYASNDGVYYARFARAQQTGIDASDAPGDPGRALVVAADEVALDGPPVVLDAGVRRALVGLVDGRSARLAGAAGPDARWDVREDQWTSDERPVMIGGGDRIVVARGIFSPTIFVSAGDGTWSPFQQLAAEGQVVALAETADDAIWALTEDKQLFRATLSGFPGQPLATDWPRVQTASDFGLATEGESAYVVIGDTLSTRLVTAYRYGASGLIDGTRAESELPVAGVDVAHPVALSDGRVCVLRLTSLTTRQSGRLYRGEVVCSRTFFRSVDGASPFEATTVGEGDWLGAELRRLGDGRLVVLATRLVGTVRDQAVVFVSSDARTWSEPIALRPGGGYGQSPAGCASEIGGTLVCLVNDNLAHTNGRIPVAPDYPAASPPVPIAVRVTVPP